MGEDLVLYKDLGGRYGLLDRHCPHRRADLSYGMVEETGIRCNYHGWLMDQSGACIEQPYDDTVNPRSRAKERCATKAYPVQGMRRAAVGLSGPAAGARAAGLGAVHLGERLPRDRALRRALQLVPVPGELLRPRALRVDARELEPAARRQDRSLWPQAPAAQVRGVRLRLHLQAHPRGHRRAQSAIGRWAASRCGRTASISATTSSGACRSTTRTRSASPGSSCGCRRGASPMCRERFRPGSARSRTQSGRWISSHVINQDIIAWVGQGAIADRTKENIGASDLGIAMIRKRFFDELDAIARGEDAEGHRSATPTSRDASSCPISRRRKAPKASRSRSSTSIRCSRSASRPSGIASGSRRRCAGPSRRRWASPSERLCAPPTSGKGN